MENLCTVLKTSLMHPEATQEAVVEVVVVVVEVVVVEVVVAEVEVLVAVVEEVPPQILQKETTRLQAQATSKRV